MILTFYMYPAFPMYNVPILNNDFSTLGLPDVAIISGVDFTANSVATDLVFGWDWTATNLMPFQLSPLGYILGGISNSLSNVSIAAHTTNYSLPFKDLVLNWDSINDQNLVLTRYVDNSKLNDYRINVPYKYYNGWWLYSDVTPNLDNNSLLYTNDNRIYDATARQIIYFISDSINSILPDFLNADGTIKSASAINLQTSLLNYILGNVPANSYVTDTLVITIPTSQKPKIAGYLQINVAFTAAFTLRAIKSNVTVQI